MKILIVTYTYPDRNDTTNGIFIHQQACALNKYGIETDVLYIDIRSIRKKRKYGFHTYMLDGITVYRYAVPGIPYKTLQLRLLSLAACKAFYKYRKFENNPQLLHGHFWESGYIAKKICKKYKLPYIITEHGSGFLQNMVSVKEKRKAKTIYDGAETIITVSKALKGVVQNITDTNIRVVGNVILDYWFKQDRVYNNKRFFTFVSSGYLIKRKCFDMIILAFQNILKLYPESRLKIIGIGPEYNHLKELTVKLDIVDKVEFMGELDNYVIPKVYSECDCFVLPSQSETFGVVYAEAMAGGLPVIATKCGGPEELVKVNVGRLIQKNNLNELIKSMIYMIEYKNEYNPADIRNYARMMFSEKVICGKLSEIYANCLKDKL